MKYQHQNTQKKEPKAKANSGRIKDWILEIFATNYKIHDLILLK